MNEEFKKRRGLSLLFFAVCALVVAACSAGAGSNDARAVAAATNSTIPSGANVGRVTETVTFPDSSGRGVLAPASSVDQPTASAEDAWVKFTGGMYATTCEGKDLSILYGLYSAKTPSIAQSDGSQKPVYAETPVWLVECKNIPLMATGVPGPVAGKNTTSPAKPDILNGIVIVDARTGTVLGGFTTPADS